MMFSTEKETAYYRKRPENDRDKQSGAALMETCTFCQCCRMRIKKAFIRFKKIRVLKMGKAVFDFAFFAVLGFVFSGCATTTETTTEQTTLILSGLTGSKVQTWIYLEGRGGIPSRIVGSSIPTDIVNGTATIPMVNNGNTNITWSGKSGVYDIIIGIDADPYFGPWYRLNSKKLDPGKVSIPFSAFTKR